MIRTILTILTVAILTPIASLIAIIIGIINPYSKIITIIGIVWARSILFTSGTKVIVNGYENINYFRT